MTVPHHPIEEHRAPCPLLYSNLRAVASPVSTFIPSRLSRVLPRSPTGAPERPFSSPLAIPARCRVLCSAGLVVFPGAVEDDAHTKDPFFFFSICTFSFVAVRVGHGQPSAATTTVTFEQIRPVSTWPSVGFFSIRDVGEISQAVPRRGVKISAITTRFLSRGSCDGGINCPVRVGVRRR